MTMTEQGSKELERLTGKLEETKHNIRENACLSKGGIWCLIKCDVDHFKETADKGTAEGSLLPLGMTSNLL